MDRTYMLSTTDNPFDPFNDFTSWYMFDCEKGHNTCARLARIANVSETMSQKEINEELERAMDFIVTHDLEDKFIKVHENQVELTENVSETH
jgi:hypothetical protein